jgi:hypothetical protein
LRRELGESRLTSVWRLGRRRTVVTAAIGHIVHWSVVHIRTMAYRGEPMCDEDFPGASYEEQIRLLADVCDNLVLALRPGRQRNPASALQYTWDSRDERQRQWITRCLALQNIDIEDLIDTHHRDGHEPAEASPRLG